MTLLPISINVSGRLVTIVGGGGVARRKCLSLLEAGARVTVVAPRLDERLMKLADEGAICLAQRPYADGDLAGSVLAYAATDDPAVNRAVAEEAHNRGIPVDVTDDPERGSFTSPAVLRRGDLVIAVSTGGGAPGFAARVRDDIAEIIGQEYAETLLILGAIREKLLTASKNAAYNKHILHDLSAAPLPEMVRSRNFEELDRTLARIAGPDFTLENLGFGRKDSP
ncbi:bifunctional precorrin-2 dehydrogenase/sirohydrochlorin ferrochelatase [Geobacter sulfurreducens]|jgi:precorrin-2 dehydrogenase/sirohydrochlorin ferrochelatase|uniref:precorrin-2 dehydrogenase n=1 Tax=Geobacter sulfurreducens (strain ATCC 51573 / DSM 12127 / PCA) TaxID=243231 RepID=Q747I4_GEOSL|nr:bifunctional precorrin-2 dehydrogenase/sirohydrochlorin ferrochelatase [Geobacter sulfurreducens]AAR36672.1 precorrin-2 dehydrogenase and sirohydrochlorin ferrochelatase, putative [Geobacter sulfurreducens PCA]QVW35067.1 bifunctional precorrin-2 dehydrogenase/sirohydrochlorin ferrochelatase [Geobacter sulfurreducens]UAC03934.1 bifunctional precorrin-2 dehydrogenase/sirohydrochlorin ferrochelatase [Geobacter sulfurreducens]UTG92573.1 bifunctional precorrin-2 dehydrogenase/sirohydrochlorin fer